jgi:hypothetical protein
MALWRAMAGGGVWRRVVACGACGVLWGGVCGGKRARAARSRRSCRAAPLTSSRSVLFWPAPAAASRRGRSAQSRGRATAQTGHTCDMGVRWSGVTVSCDQGARGVVQAYWRGRVSQSRTQQGDINAGGTRGATKHTSKREGASERASESERERERGGGREREVWLRTARAAC